MHPKKEKSHKNQYGKKKMKNLGILLSFLFILLASTVVRFSRADASPEAVRDIDGDKLRAGVNYYILPVIRGRGGGLTLGNLQSETCPLNVVQEQFEVMNGLPTTFAPVNPKREWFEFRRIWTCNSRQVRSAPHRRCGNWTNSTNRLDNGSWRSAEAEEIQGWRRWIIGSKLRSTVGITSWCSVRVYAISVKWCVEILESSSRMERGLWLWAIRHSQLCSRKFDWNWKLK